MPRGDSFELQGLNGGVVISSAESPVAGEFRWIQVVNDAVLDALGGDSFSGSTLENIGVLIGPTLPAGLGIGGRFTGVSVTSGIVIAYKW